MIALDQIIPKWTKRIVTDNGGRDPLGLSRVSFLLTDYLLTGIITTTDRARYYSFYCWALWHIEQESAASNYDDFVANFRRREAALALATIAHDPNTSPVGVEATRVQFDKGKASGFLDSDFKVLPSNSLGGYGQYYAGSLYHLRLTHRPEDFIDKVTTGAAKELARAFHRTIENTPYIKNRLFEEREIPYKDLIKSKNYLTLDALSESFAAEEKQKLIELFFNLNQEAADDKTILRRQTLTFLLYLLAEFNKNGYYPNAARTKTLDEYLLYSTYYGVLWCKESAILPFPKPDNFGFCCSLWRQFCLHQFLTQSLELLLYSVIETVGAETAGLEPNAMVENILQPEFFTTLSEYTGARTINSPSELFEAIGLKEIPDQETSIEMQRKWLPDSRLSEAQILTEKFTNPSTATAFSMLLLALIYGKWRGISNDAGMNYLARHAGKELWIQRLFPHLDKWFDPAASWETALRELLDVFVLQQHDRIMYEKRRLDSCRLRQTDGRIFKEQDYHPVWRASRFSNAMRVMSDLGLVKTSAERDLEITEQGEKLLQELLQTN